MKINQLLESASSELDLNNKYKAAGNTLVPKWQKTGLLEGAAMEQAPQDKNHMAILLENQIKQVLVETTQTNNGGATAAGGAGEQWAGIVLPMVRKVFGQISAKEFMVNQPLQLPDGLVFYLDFKYSDQQPTIGAGATSRFNIGDNIYGTTDTTNVDPFGGLYGAGRFAYSINEYSATIPTGSITVATASAQDINYNGLLSASAAGNTLRKLTIATASAVLTNFDKTAVRSFVFTGSGIGEANIFPEFTSYNSTFDQLSFIVSGSIVTPANSNPVSAVTSYFSIQTLDNLRGDYETTDARPLTGSASIPSVDFAPRSEKVTAKTRKLKYSYTQEAQQDYQAYQSINIEQEATSLLSDYISKEIDLELLDMVNQAASGTTEVWSAKNNRFFDKTTGLFADQAAGAGGFYNSQNEWFQTLGTKMESVSKQIHAKTQRGEANVVTCGPRVAVVLESMNGYTANSNGSKMEYYAGAKESGKLNNKFKIIVNPYMQENILLMGFKGSNYLESGAAFCPYIPLISTPLVYNPDTFKMSKALSTRYAKKVLRREFFGKVFIADLNQI